MADPRRDVSCLLRFTIEKTLEGLARIKPVNVSLGGGQVLISHDPALVNLPQMVGARGITVDDVALVRPCGQVAQNGLVLAGYSALDESMVTRESPPVEKHVGRSDSRSGPFGGLRLF